MKNFLKERFGELGAVIWYSGLTALAFVIVIGVGYLILAKAQPWWLGVQREAQGQSKSFVDSNNKAISMYMADYAVLDTKIAEATASNNGMTEDLIVAYKAQQKAIMTKVCQTAGQMVPGTVDGYNQKFISEHGGCH
jgi:hypothetical protein